MTYTVCRIINKKNKKNKSSVSPYFPRKKTRFELRQVLRTYGTITSNLLLSRRQTQWLRGPFLFFSVHFICCWKLTGYPNIMMDPSSQITSRSAMYVESICMCVSMTCPVCSVRFLVLVSALLSCLQIFSVCLFFCFMNNEVFAHTALNILRFVGLFIIHTYTWAGSKVRSMNPFMRHLNGMCLWSEINCRWCWV